MKKSILGALGIFWGMLFFIFSGGISLADISNGSFENGLIGWTLTPNNLGQSGLIEIVTSVGAVSPTHGTKMAKITLGTVNGSAVDFNFFHTGETLISSGNHVQFKLKVLYNSFQRGERISLIEAILKNPTSGQPLIAGVNINLKQDQTQVTNFITGETSSAALIDNGPSGFSHETAWLSVDINVSQFAGQTVPLSLFMNGGSHVTEGQTVVYLIDDVKIVTPQFI